MAKRRCKSKTKAGKRCRAWALHDRDACLAHADQKTRDEASFGGAYGGRPRNPRAVEVLRERIEADIERWLRPLEDGLTADRGLVVGDGEHARVEYVTDHGTRIKAQREAFDRAFGRPTQPTREDHTGDALEREIERLTERLAEKVLNGNRPRKPARV